MENKPLNLTVSISPHIRAKDSTTTLMMDVVIALLPALVGAVYFFGMRALLVTLVSVVACVFFEWGYRKIMKMDQTIYDGSAMVTGVLLAFVCPVTVPLWALVIGDFFAIVIVKQLFGGIGQNFLNPALAARAFMFFSWSTMMATWYPTGTSLNLLTGAAGADAVTAATPMSFLHAGQLPAESAMMLFTGNVGGCLGETSALLLLLGGVYLVVRKVISPRIPVAYIATVAVLALLFPQGNDRVQWMLAQLFGGGLFLGAIFMATDYVTSPVTKAGQLIYGIGCGLVTIFIRYFGAWPEGVSFAILVMNACVMLFDRIGRPRRFGVVKGGDKA